MQRTRRLALHRTTGPTSKVLAKGHPGLSAAPPTACTKGRPFTTKALRVTLTVPCACVPRKGTTGDPALAETRRPMVWPSRPWLASPASPASRHHTHQLAEQQQQHRTQPASLAALKTTKYSRGNPVTAAGRGGSKPLVVKPTVKPTRLPLQQPALGQLNQWGRSKTNLGNDGLTLSSS